MRQQPQGLSLERSEREPQLPRAPVNFCADMEVMKLSHNFAFVKECAYLATIAVRLLLDYSTPSKLTYDCRAKARLHLQTLSNTTASVYRCPVQIRAVAQCR